MQFLKMLSILALAVVFMPVGMQAQEITPVRAKLRANKGTLVVDVRERDEVATVAYDVKNVVNIPLSELKSRMTEIPKDKPVILACKTGARSSQALGILKANGYTKVSNIEGGILAWEAKDLGVVKGGEPTKACCSGSAAKNCSSASASADAAGAAAKACCSGSTAKNCSSASASADAAGAAAKACCSGSAAGAAAKNCGSAGTSAATTDAAAPAKACCAGGEKAEAAKSCGSGGTSTDATGTAAPAKACCAGGAKAGNGGR